LLHRLRTWSHSLLYGRDVPNLTDIEGWNISGKGSLQLRFLTELVAARLALAPPYIYALARARTFFEHFKRDHVLKDVMMDPQRTEVIIQRYLEEFLFFEGFFPVVHCESNRGKLDLVLDLCEKAKGRGDLPALVELKQVVSLKRLPTSREVHDAAADA